MKAIILAAWKWTRLAPVTENKPKPLINILGKSILEYNMESIYDEVNEIIIIVKYQKDKIIAKLWNQYKKTKITYVEQWDENWTWAALKNINCNEDVIILYWDSILDKKDIKKVIKSDWYASLVKIVEDPSKYWIMIQDKDWYATKVVEKPKDNVWNLANLWCYKFSKEIFTHINKIVPSVRWEYELTDALNLFLKNNKLKLIEIEWEFIDISYPWDILNANINFCKKIKKSKIKWKIEDGVTIHWNVILEKWAIIKSWTYIEGNVVIWKDTTVWPFTHIRWNTIIWENCIIWSTELKDCVIWNNVKSKHFWYIWYSVIWDNVNIWCWIITADLRHDKKNIKMLVKWELVDTWRYKMWVIIWDNAMTWINTGIYPWRIIPTNWTTLPWEIVK